MEGELTTVQQKDVGLALAPELVLENARTAAKALQDVISHKKNPVIMNGEQYLEYEDWQLCGQFYGYAVKTGDAVPVEVDGVKGAKAHADLINLKTGLIVGGADAYCLRDEDKWNTRPKYEWQGEGENRKRVKIGDETVPWFQLASMAQTRSGAKALRNRVAWVVVLAGYRPTPAEELTGNESAGVTVVDKTQHWCAQHSTAFFKKGKMKSFGHPILESGKWCHEPSVTEGEYKEVPEAPAVPEASKQEPAFTPATGKAVDELYGKAKQQAGDKAPESVPQNAGELFTWLTDPKKKRLAKGTDPKGFALACGVTEQQLKEDVPGAYKIVKGANPEWAEYPN